jgi:hypothetical protein
MKKLITFAFTLALGANLSFTQATGGTPGKSATGKKVTKEKTHRKSKKGSGGGTTTPPPK